MRHLLLTLRYRGTNYHGFQVQQNALSVAQVVQDAVEAVFGARLDVKGCSRHQDAGVARQPLRARPAHRERHPPATRWCAR